MSDYVQEAALEFAIQVDEEESGKEPGPATITLLFAHQAVFAQPEERAGEPLREDSLEDAGGSIPAPSTCVSEAPDEPRGGLVFNLDLEIDTTHLDALIERCQAHLASVGIGEHFGPGLMTLAAAAREYYAEALYQQEVARRVLGRAWQVGAGAMVPVGLNAATARRIAEQTGAQLIEGITAGITDEPATTGAAEMTPLECEHGYRQEPITIEEEAAPARWEPERWAVPSFVSRSYFTDGGFASAPLCTPSRRWNNFIAAAHEFAQTTGQCAPSEDTEDPDGE